MTTDGQALISTLLEESDQWSVFSLSTETDPSKANPSGNEGTFLYGRRFVLNSSKKKSEAPRLRILFLHDLGEHANRYEDYFKSFLNLFFQKKAPPLELVSYDFRGHGKSGGTRGHLESIDQLCEDTLKFINNESESYEASLVMGIGLGSIVGLKILQHYFSKLQTPITGLILVNPGLKLNWSLPGFAMTLAKRGGFFTSRIKFPFRLEGKLFAGESAVAEEFDCDPLVNHTLTLGSLFELQHHASQMRTSAYYLDLPVYIALSGKGRLYSSEIAELFSRGIVKGELNHFPDADHDLFHHFDCENFNLSVYNWLNRHSFFIGE